MQKAAIKEAVKKEATLKAAKAKEQKDKALSVSSSNHKVKKSNDMGKQQQSNKVKPKSVERANHVSTGDEPPKGLENALKGLKKDKITSMIQELPTRFPNHQIIWLKDVADYINSRVNQDPPDPTFSSKPHDYPLSLIKKDIQEPLISLLSRCSPDVLRTFHLDCFDKISDGLETGKTTAGYRVMIQALAIVNPDISISYAKFKEYEPRFSKSTATVEANILSFLWCAIQPAFHSPQAALKIWMEVFKPYVGHKFLGKYVLECLGQVLDTHTAAKEHKHLMEVKDFIQFMEYVYIFEKSANATKKIVQSLQTSYLKCRDLIYLKQSKKVKDFFPAFLSVIRPNVPESLRNEACLNLVRCLNATNHCYTLWRQIYKSNLNQTCTLLEFIQSNWNKKVARIANPKLFKDTLQQIRAINSELIKSNKAPKCLPKLDNLAKSLSSQAREHKVKSKGSSLWKTFTFTLIVAALIFVDCQTHGSFKASLTYRALEKSLALEYGQWFWSDICIPYYTKASATVAPYANVAWKHVSETTSALWEKSGPVKEWVDRVMPPLIEHFEKKIWPSAMEYMKEGLVIAGNAMSTGKDMAVEYSGKAGQWLEQNVFTGSLSKENIAEFARNTTTTIGGYLDIVYQQAMAKYRSFTK
ncbi:transmembrane protein 214 isoform X2 [Brevipalpus obovatus]